MFFTADDGKLWMKEGSTVYDLASPRVNLWTHLVLLTPKAMVGYC